VCRELLEREIWWTSAEGRVRFSPHFYNRIEECDFAIEQVDDILRTHAWEKHAAAATRRDLMDPSGNSGGSTRDNYEQARHEMVETQIRKRHVTSSRLLECLERVPRHEFVPRNFAGAHMRMLRFPSEKAKPFRSHTS